MSTAQKKRLLDISHLNEVLQVLKKYGYSGTSYYRLGLSLGLLATTLDVIKAENVNNIAGSLRECLSAWLRRADNVESNGGSTMETLLAALRSIEENSVADVIYKEKLLPGEILVCHTSTLAELIDDPIHMARVLCGEKIIEETALASVESTRRSLPERKKVILTAVQEAVYADKQNLEKFAAILLLFTATVSVGHAILKDYRKEFPDDSSELVTERGGSLKIRVPLSLNSEFTKMRTKFGKFFYDVDRAVSKTSLTKGDLVKHLRFSYPHLKPQLIQCEDICDVLQLISEKCSLVNIGLLEGVVNELNIEGTKIFIKQYKESIEEFCDKISVRLALNEKFSFCSPLSCEVATFHVDGSVDDYTLNDVKALLKVAFERLSLNVRVDVIREGNSFTITCSFPLALTESLIASALENLELLKKKGLLQLTIGYSTVYSIHDQVKEISDDKGTLVKESTVSSAVYTSRGTLEQMIVSLSVQLVNEKDEHREELASLNEKLTEVVKESKSLQDSESILRELLKEKDEEIEQLLLKEKEKYSTSDSQETIEEEATDSKRWKELEVKEQSNDKEDMDKESILVQQLLENEKELQRQLKESTEYIETLTVPESELREKLLTREKQIRAMRLENEQLRSSLQTKAGLEEETELLQDKISLVSVQLIDREEKIQQLLEDNQSLQSQLVELRATDDDKEKPSSVTSLITEQSSLQSGQVDDRLTMMESLQLFEFISERRKKLNIPAIDDILNKPLHTTNEISALFVKSIQEDPALLAKLRQAKRKYEEKRVTGSVQWSSDKLTLISPSAQECREAISGLTDSHRLIVLDSLSPDIAQLLLPSVLERKTVQGLYIFDTPLTHQHILSISDLLTANNSLEGLQLSNCSITDRGMESLCRALVYNSTLTWLSLDRNPLITSQSIQSLAHLLLNNSTLTLLHLYNTPGLTSDGVRLLLDTLVSGRRYLLTLKELWLDERHRNTCEQHPKYELFKDILSFV